jgi:two-component system, OmpR family, sensor histidine kinase PrrB
MRSLRGRLSLGVGLVIALVLGVAGFSISSYTEQVAREGLDDRLRDTARLSQATAVDAFETQLPARTDRRLEAVLGAADSSLRLLIGERVVLDAGPELLTGASPRVGLSTVARDGGRYRVLVTPIRYAGLDGRLEVTQSLAELERRQADLDRRLLLLGVLALVIAGLGTFAAAVGLLNPLRRLRTATGRIAVEADLDTRVPETDGPAEVRELAASFNAMLARLERASAATRRFTLDAGHELRTPLTTVQATLSALHRHPEVAPEQRTAMLADALAEQRRLVDLLDGLQALARGDAMTHRREPVDLTEVVARVAAEAGGVATELPEAPVVIEGWEEGLRLLVANLVANAQRHGGGGVWVTLLGGTAPELHVDDDAEGVPPADRERIFEPFERLPAAAEREGSGLGLALVAQQAREHGAAVTVADSPRGGARFSVRFGRR